MNSGPIAPFLARHAGHYECLLYLAGLDDIEYREIETYMRQISYNGKLSRCIEVFFS